MIFDNPQAFVLCHYKRAQALCHRDGVRDTPTLDRCVPGCGNIIRTDKHAAQLRERAEFLEKRAAFAARPIGDRLRANAARLRDLADTHDHTRITALAQEAQVPRNALTQRHTDLKNKFYEQVKARGATLDVEVRLRAEIAKLKKTIANKNEKLAQLEADVPALVRAVHVLTMENQELREQLAQPHTNVVAFRASLVEPEGHR